MINEEEKLKQYIVEQGIEAEHIHFEESLHSVQDALRVSGFSLNNIIKTIVFKTSDGKVVAGIVPAEFRVSKSSLCAATGLENLEVATFDEAYQLTGYPAGGTPCFGYEATFVADPKVFDLEYNQGYVYTGGGSEFALTKISTDEIKRISSPIIMKIRGNKSN